MTAPTRVASRNGSGPTPGPSRQAPRLRVEPRRQPGTKRNSGRIALGLVVLVLSALAAAVLYSSAADRETVIGVARAVPAGHKVVAADLREVSISSGSGLDTISVADVSSVVGRTATVSLTDGSLMSAGQLSDGPTLPKGTVVAGAVLAAGQYPVGLAVGDTVDVIETNAPDAAGTGKAVAHGQATVTDLAESTDGQGLLTVSLAVPADASTAVSAAGAAGRISLVVTSP